MRAPDTFDVAGYVAAVERIRRPDEVYVARFDRTVDAAVAGAIVVPPAIPLVITEGNYLLVESGGWERSPRSSTRSGTSTSTTSCADADSAPGI